MSRVNHPYAIPMDGIIESKKIKEAVDKTTRLAMLSGTAPFIAPAQPAPTETILRSICASMVLYIGDLFLPTRQNTISDTRLLKPSS